MKDNTRQIRERIERQSESHPLGDIRASYRRATWASAMRPFSAFAASAFDFAGALQRMVEAARHTSRTTRYRAAIITDHGVSSIDATDYATTDGFNLGAKEPRP